MKKLAIIILLLTLIVSAEGRFKVGYAGTYNDDIDLNGFVVGGGVLTERNMYIGGELSLEFYREGFEALYYNAYYDLSRVYVNLRTTIVTPAFTMGYKYVRLKLGIPVITAAYDVDTDTDDKTSTTQMGGFALGLQVLTPFRECSGGMFFEPGFITYEGETSFTVRVGLEL